ncbi:hypothetical protein [Georgenia thermotolerans]|uniref:Uncharacterized protein n=1 Tax=Georgenia thermotolerans TaxID=527326 RepID=A0A7J5UK52_9MICO|nr:hypothetical protein [Georgenia thermotolerans]KAE8762762.1 hypothetical protein GB883_17670 [Georgenia thermotolerans]
MWVWIVGAVLLVLAVLGLWFEVRNQLGRASERAQGHDPQLAEDLRRLRWEIDRGHEAGDGFIPP